VRKVAKGELPLSKIASDRGVHVTHVRSFGEAYRTCAAEAFPDGGYQLDRNAHVAKPLTTRLIEEHEVILFMKPQPSSRRGNCEATVHWKSPTVVPGTPAV
jgi:hypothetical protein